MEQQNTSGTGLNLFEGVSREDIVSLNTFPVGFGDFLISAARDRKTAKLVYGELTSMKESGFVLDNFFHEVRQLAQETVSRQPRRRRRPKAMH
jgi:hypothetical protein